MKIENKITFIIGVDNLFFSFPFVFPFHIKKRKLKIKKKMKYKIIWCITANKILNLSIQVFNFFYFKIYSLKSICEF